MPLETQLIAFGGTETILVFSTWNGVFLDAPFSKERLCTLSLVSRALFVFEGGGDSGLRSSLVLSSSGPRAFKRRIDISRKRLHLNKILHLNPDHGVRKPRSYRELSKKAVVGFPECGNGSCDTVSDLPFRTRLPKRLQLEPFMRKPRTVDNKNLETTMIGARPTGLKRRGRED